MSLVSFLLDSTEKRLIPGGYDVYNGDLNAAIRSGAQWPVNEPLAVISAMAAVTESTGFGVTVSTIYEQPYHLARRLSTLDHLSKGVQRSSVLFGIENNVCLGWAGMFVLFPIYCC